MEKRVMLAVFIGIALVVGFGYAYNSGGTGGNPAQVGHSIDEIDWSRMIPGFIKAGGVCIGNDCRTNWVWNIVGENIFNLNNGSVGIGTSTPSAKLDVAGDVKVSGNAQMGNAQMGNANITGNICLSNGCRNSWISEAKSWNISGNDSYNMNSGNIGIGTSTPSAKLDVAGDVKISGNVQIGGNLNVQGICRDGTCDPVYVRYDPSDTRRCEERYPNRGITVGCYVQDGAYYKLCMLLTIWVNKWHCNAGNLQYSPCVHMVCAVY